MWHSLTLSLVSWFLCDMINNCNFSFGTAFDSSSSNQSYCEVVARNLIFSHTSTTHHYHSQTWGWKARKTLISETKVSSGKELIAMNLTLKHNILKLGQIPDFVNPCSQQSQQYLNALKSSYYDVISIFFTHVTVHHSDFNLQYSTCDFKFGSVRNPTLFHSRRFFNSQLWYLQHFFASKLHGNLWSIFTNIPKFWFLGENWQQWLLWMEIRDQKLLISACPVL